MKNFAVSSWQDYWKLFDTLLVMVNAEGKQEIAAEFKAAQLYVNGLTDGWYDFLNAFESAVKSRKMEMTAEQFEIAEFLITSLNKSLLNRN